MRCTVGGQEATVSTGAYQHPLAEAIDTITDRVVSLTGFYRDTAALFRAISRAMRRRKRRPTNALARAKRRMVTR